MFLQISKESIKQILIKKKYTIILLALMLFVVYFNFFVYKLGYNGVALILMAVCIVLKKEKFFLKELLFPLLCMYLYEYSRAEAYGWSQLLNRPLLDQVLVDWERYFFSIDGTTLGVWLQDNFSNVASGSFVPNWYDYFLFFTYSSFGWFWATIAAVAMKKDIKYFRKYIYGFIGLSLFSVLIYIFFPSAPPWYASDTGILVGSERIFFMSKYFNIDYEALVNNYGHNDFAAFPSLHAGWSFYAALWGEHLLGAKWLWLFLVPALIIFATWYGGEHYIIDSVFGCALAGIAFLITTKESWIGWFKK